MKRNFILLVEDNPDDQALTLRALQKHHILNDVVIAHDGAEAVSLLFHSAPDSETPLPEVVLLDLNLPKLSGIEVFRRIREDQRTKVLPVIVLTSSDEEKAIVEAHRLGVAGYVRKPFDFAQFTDGLRRLGVHWLLLKDSPPTGPE